MPSKTVTDDREVAADLDDVRRRSTPLPPLGAAALAGAPDAVEAALARALDAAAVAGRFDVVGQLAHELEARRLAREPNVITFARRRREP